MPEENVGTFERPSTNAGAVASITAVSEDEGYSGDYFSEESETENSFSSDEETHRANKKEKLRRNPYHADVSDSQSESPPSAHESIRSLIQHSEDTLSDGDDNSSRASEETLSEHRQHPCTLMSASSAQGQPTCTCCFPYSQDKSVSEGTAQAMTPYCVTGPLETFFSEQHCDELQRFLQFMSSSDYGTRVRFFSCQNELFGDFGMVINTAESHYEILDPLPSSHAIIRGFVCYRGLPCMSPTNELSWLSMEAYTTFGNNTDSKYFMLLENTTMKGATSQLCQGICTDSQCLRPQQRAASSPFYSFLSPASVLDLQVSTITSQYGTPVSTFLLALPVGDPFFFPDDRIGYASRKIKIECKGHLNILESDGCTSIAQVSQTKEVVVNVKRTKVIRNGVCIHSEAPV